MPGQGSTPPFYVTLCRWIAQLLHRTLAYFCPASPAADPTQVIHPSPGYRVEHHVVQSWTVVPDRRRGGRRDDRPVSAPPGTLVVPILEPDLAGIPSPLSAIVPTVTPSTNPSPRHLPPHGTEFQKQILFYDINKPYYGFTNFSDHQILYNEKKYPTSEHLFQAHKFLLSHPEIAERIRTCSQRPRAALSEARRLQAYVRADWLNVNVNIMEEVLRLKFTQHGDLAKELLSTDHAELIEDSSVDSFWGWGSDRKGRNELGKCLMRLRDELRLNHHL